MPARPRLQAVLLFVLLAVAAPLLADNFTLTGSGGNWSNTSIWLQNAAPAVRTPGSLIGTIDVVNLATPLYTVNVDLVLAERVALQLTCGTGPCIADVIAGGLLKLTGTGTSSIGFNSHLKISGGAVDNAGDLDFLDGSFFDWNSGTLGGTGTTHLAYDSSNPALLSLVNGTLDAHTLEVDGKVVYTGAFVINNGGQVNISVNGIFDIQTIGGITTNNPLTSKITNAGTFEKTAGAGGTNIGVPLDNNGGIVKAWFNALVMSAGAHTNGNFNIAAGCSLEVAGSFTGNCTISGAGSAVIVGTPEVTNGSTLNLQNVTMNAGWLQGPAAGSAVANISGLVTFHSGVWRRNLTVNMLTGSTLDVTGTSGAFLDAANVINNPGALIQVNPGVGSLAINTGSVLTNNGTMQLIGDVTITSDGVSAPRIVNNSLLEKTAGAGIARIGAQLDNSAAGTITVSSGQLAANGGGTNNGTINIAAATNEFVVESNVYTLGAGTTLGIVHLGWFKVAGGTLSLSTTLTLKFVHLSSGTLRGADMIINNALKWHSGTILGPGTTTIVNTASVDLANLTGTAILNNRTLHNNGAATYNAGAFGLDFTNGAIWNNDSGSTFNITGDGAIGSTAGVNTFNNQTGGSITKNGGASGTRFDVVLTNDGSISSNSAGGTIIVNNGGLMTGGSLNVSNSANIHFFNGTFTISAGALSGSPGVITILGTGRVDVTGDLASTADFAMSNGGTLDVAATRTFTIDDFFWSGGTIQGAGQTRVTTYGLITNAAPTTLNGGHIFKADTLLDYNADATNFLTVNGTSQIQLPSTATMNLGADGVLAGASTASIANQGSIKKIAGPGTSRIDIPIVSTAGGIGVAPSGTLQLKTGGGTGSLSNTTIATGNGKVHFDGSYGVGAGSAISGTGTIQITSGTITVTPSLTIPSLQLDGGTLTGGGNLLLDGGTWTGGDMDGTGTTTVNTAETFEIATGTPKKLRRPFVNNGTLLFQNLPAALTMENAAVLTNNALTEFQTNTNFFCTCLPTPSRFHNAATGTLHQFNAAGTSNFLTLFDNDGTVDLDTGILNFLNGGTHTGSFTPGGPTYLSFAGPSDSFSAASSITGSGAVGFGATTSSFSGTYNVTGANSLTRVQGNVTFNSASTINVSALEMLSGSIAGTADISVLGGSSFDSVWQSGTISGSGALTLAGGTVSDWSASAGPIALDGRTISNGGTIHYTATANTLTILNAGSVNNTGMFDVQADAAVVSGAGGPNTFANSGTFQKTGAGGITSFGPAFTNSNVVNLVSGSVDFDGGFTQSAGATTLNGGDMGGSLATLNGGTLTGNGTVASDVINGASIQPGTSPGAITIDGDYTQTNAGTLFIELLGTTPATQYDQLNVTGTASLDGTLDVTLIGGYIPSGGETYDVLTFASRSSDFAVMNLPTFPMGGTIEANYLPAAAATKLQLAALVTQADVAVSQTTSGPALHNDNVTFTVTVTNNGPSTATGVVLNDTFANAAFVSATTTVGSCSGTGPITCNIGTLTAGQSAVVSIVLQATTVGPINNTAGVTSTTLDPVSANDGPDVASITVSPKADLAVAITDAPDPVDPLQNVTYTVTVTNNGPDNATSANVALNISNGTILGAAGAPFGCTGSGANANCSVASLAPGSVDITVSVQAPASGTITLHATASSATGDAPTSNNSNVENTTVNVVCTNTTPIDLQPSAGATAPASGTLSWSGDGSSYVVYLGPAGSGCSMEFGTTAANSLAYTLAGGTAYEWRVASLADDCPAELSSCVTFTTETTCTIPLAPLARVVAHTTTDKTYTVEWDTVPGAVRYELDEATNPAFANAQTHVVVGLAKSFKHDVAEPTPFYYRVRAFKECTTEGGPYSPTVRAVIVPLPDEEGPQDINVPAGSTELIVQRVFIPGQAGQTHFFTAATDRPWITTHPQSGILTPAGITLELTADPATLPNGTFTASIIVTLSETSGATRAATNATTKLTLPISINLVTPVSPVENSQPASPHALIIPTVGHLDGINSHWQSDVRVTNAGFSSTRYRLTFTPAAGIAQGVQQTTITVAPGATTALDDVIESWYGVGALGETASGMLEILPLDDPAVTSLTTVASSRTYNVTAAGTLGQFIPAIRYGGFIGKALNNALPDVLSIQQISQTGAYRSNVGVVDGSGLGASVLMSFFNSAGSKLLELPLQLAPGEQRQLNGVLAQNGITLPDGRVEVQVTGGTGKVTAYASVVDNLTNDPLLVSGTLLATTGASRWVLPGVANLDNPLAHWRTDVRIFNRSPSDQPATLTFYTGNGAAPRTAQLLLEAEAVLALDNIVRTTFGAENAGGVVHLDTGGLASLIVTGRTYNETAAGTFGQFINAVTPGEATGISERTLHILQVEDSVRYRTNLGLAEVTGHPVTVEVQVILPDSLVTPTVQIPLAANEFRTVGLIRELGLGNIYNARITIRVIEGQGRVTAYGSVIDELTQDPTYVPAQ